MGSDHEPSVWELKATLDGLRELMKERHERYAERDEATKDRAAVTEAALKEYKIGANEWRDTVKDLIGNLRESRSQSTGHAAGVSATTAMIFAVAGLLIGFIPFLIQLLVKS